MLSAEQQTAEVGGLTGADIVIALQIIQRLVSTGNIRDEELATVGTARNNLVAALQNATGVNYDMARAAQQRALQEAQAKARAAQEAPEADAPVVEDAPAEEAAGDESE